MVVKAVARAVTLPLKRMVKVQRVQMRRKYHESWFCQTGKDLFMLGKSPAGKIHGCYSLCATRIEKRVVGSEKRIWLKELKINIRCQSCDLIV